MCLETDPLGQIDTKYRQSEGFTAWHEFHSKQDPKETKIPFFPRVTIWNICKGLAVVHMQNDTVQTAEVWDSQISTKTSKHLNNAAWNYALFFLVFNFSSSSGDKQAHFPPNNG